ncbi:MAG: COR domain-containing protein [Saprospiraceae bacterium]
MNTILMPKSWAAARQHFMDNLAKAEGERERLISKEAFFKRCEEDFKVRKEAIPSLLTLLHHSGVVYHNEEFLQDIIIVDQRWALDAIYEPLKRGSGFYEKMRKDWFGKVRVENIFNEFSFEKYSDKEKRLFLNFMQSCGLCFP